MVPGYLMGGEKKKSEKARIRKGKDLFSDQLVEFLIYILFYILGMNILVTTPGRLLDHLSSTKNLNLGRLHWLAMDEADRLLDMGYEKDVAEYVKLLILFTNFFF